MLLCYICIPPLSIAVHKRVIDERYRENNVSAAAAAADIAAAFAIDAATNSSQHTLGIAARSAVTVIQTGRVRVPEVNNVT